MTQPEYRLAASIMAAIRERGGWCFKVHGSEHQTSGVPDVIGCIDGYMFGVEVKMPGNKISSIQRFRIGKMREAGALVAVAYGTGDALAMIDHVRMGYHAMCARVEQPCPWAHPRHEEVE